jgi:glutamine---fructose-6-phosphate transaminase (isomerizing)
MNNHFTYTEIHRQHNVWRGVIAALEKEKERHAKIVGDYRERMWVFTGCGTSYYLAQTASALFEMITGFRTKAVPASEILLYPELVFNAHERYLAVAFSRSGTTTEIVKAVEKTKNELSIPVLVVSCDATSPLVQAGDMVITFPFQTEQSVVMTGSFTSMLLSVVQMALQAVSDNAGLDELRDLPAAADAAMAIADALIPPIISRSFSQFVFLAQGPFVGLAHEAALKMNEMSISYSRSFHALEYRHGPMSTTSSDTLITILASERGIEYELQLAEDMKKLGAQILLLHDHTLADLPGAIDYHIAAPGPGGDRANAFAYMPVLQLLGYYNAIHKKLNPDQPQNLSAVVKLSI